MPITYLSLETTGVGTAISQELLMGNSEHYGSMVEKLEPGEEKVVTYPYEICSIWFHKKDWENVEKRSFWLTFSSYPDKIINEEQVKECRNCSPKTAKMHSKSME